MCKSQNNYKNKIRDEMKTFMKFIISQMAEKQEMNPTSKFKKTVVSTNLIMGILVYLFQLKNVWNESESKPIQQKLLLFKNISSIAKEVFGQNKIALIKSFLQKRKKEKTPQSPFPKKEEDGKEWFEDK